MTISIEIDDEEYSRVVKLSEEGNHLVERNDFEGALKKFRAALDLLPSPKNRWDASLWLYASIGDMYLFTEDFENAKTNYFNALNCPDGMENSFVHLRLGETLYELGENDKAVDHLLKAYMLEGSDIFREEENKYFEFLKQQVDLSI